MEIGFTKFDADLHIAYDHEASRILGKDYWRVLKSFRYYIGEKGSNRWVTVPAGYLTDGASVPQIFWSLVPRWGKYGQAVVVHDILCEYLSIVEDGETKSICREEADDILLEAMVVLDVPEATRTIISSAVGLYRVVADADEPSNEPLKRELESRWVA